MPPKCKTIFMKNVICKNVTSNLYEYLVNNIEWEDGVRSKKGETRKAKALNIGDIPEIDDVIISSLINLTSTQYVIFGIYLNFYENGDSWTPNHSHKDTHQLVISLGTSRKLCIGKKEYLMEDGDVILFGSSTHGVPKDSEIREGRISIATFMTPINSII